MVRSPDRCDKPIRLALSQKDGETVSIAGKVTVFDKPTGDSLILKTRTWKKSVAIFPLVFLTILAGCATSEPVAGPLSGEFEGSSAVAVLQNVNNQALKCWIKSGDKRFKGLALVPELDTRSGKPRILIVRKGKAQALPQMVIEADGKPVRLSTYGPLTSTSLSSRINRDIIAWNTGRTSCSPA